MIQGRLPGKVCIYSYGIWKTIADESEDGTGGAEFQLRDLAFRLQARGCEVTFLVGEFGQRDVEWTKGFRCVKAFSADNSTFFGRFSYFFKALRSAAGDVVIERGTSDKTFWLALFCFLFRRRFIFCAASDVNFILDAPEPPFATALGRMLYRVAMHIARAIIVQKESQHTLVHEAFGRPSVIIRNFPPPQFANTERASNSDALWVSNIIQYKRPEFVLELAERLSEIRFTIVGGARDHVYFELIRNRASALPNVEFVGFVPVSLLGPFFSSTKILINTSLLHGRFEEGFPNTFLQAWQAGVPVISLHSNPDGILGKYNLGICSHTLDKMAEDIGMLVADVDRRRCMGENGQRYVREFHNSEKIENQYMEVLSS